MRIKAIFTLLFLFLILKGVFGQSHTSSGTGFFVSSNGVIVTCAHVIEDADRVAVKIGDQEYPAQVVAMDNETDLAILRINYANPYHFRLTRFDAVNLGDKVFVLGFPLSDILGSDIRLTDGIVSARSGINADATYFQISAPIQPGNSGGPIFNESFEVKGVAAHKLSDMSTLVSSGVIPQNINFGVKSDFIYTLSNASPVSLRAGGERGGISIGNGNITTMNQAISATVQILCYESDQRSGSSINIANRTGYTIYYIYVSPATSDSWGTDRLGSNVLMTGRSFQVSSLDLSPRNLYDILIIDEDSDTYTFYDISLSPNQTIEITLDDLDDRNTTTSGRINASPTTFAASNDFVTIVNNTGYTIYFVHISPSSSTSWGQDLLGSDVLRDGESVRVPLPQNQNNLYDIQLTDSDIDTYTRMNVRLTRNQRIEFTIRDLDLDY